MGLFQQFNSVMVHRVAAEAGLRLVWEVAEGLRSVAEEGWPGACALLYSYGLLWVLMGCL